MAKAPRKKLVLLDAHALIHRAYHALPAFTNSQGEPTGALYGLIAMILKIMEELDADYVAACYDLPGKTFRHEAYADYKGTRGETDSELVTQLQSSRDVCEAFAIPIYDAPGFEADDMLGTIAHQLKDSKDIDVIIASGDMDTLQLADKKHVQIFTLRKGIKDTVLYDEKAVKDRFGFGPKLLPDYKGLRGDPSDNIIGIKGIGEKGATKLITEFGSLEKMYKQLHKDPQKFLDAGIKQRVINLLTEGEDDALFSKVLATIRRDAPVVYEFPKETWHEALVVQEDVLEKMFARYEMRTLWMRVKKLLHKVNGEEEQVLDEKKKTSKEKDVPQATPQEIREVAVALWLSNSDLTHPGLEDIYTQTGERNFEKARTKILKDLEKQGLTKLYEEVEKPLVPILAEMQKHGILLDTKFLEKLSKNYHKKLDALEKNIFKVAGEEFNIKSSKQLGEVLFTTLELPTKGIKKTATGYYSTKESELEKLREHHTIIEDILNYRELQKLLSTYIDNMPDLVGDDERLHPELLQDGTSTGRFSSQNPNIQNIPIRSTLAKDIRRAFVAPKGFKLVAMDYSQIELRIAAMMAADKYMTKVFVGGGDIHAAVAAKVFEVAEDEVSKEQRRRAKVINFGMLYGMGVSALQKNLGSTRAEAQEFYNTYFEQFPSIAQYMEITKVFARKNGYTETIFNRRRYFPTINSGPQFMRAMAERMAINAPIQGTEADIIKLAMIRVDAWIKSEDLSGKVFMIAQVHDELLFEIADEVIDEVVPAIEKIMQDALSDSYINYKTKIPLKVDTHIGPSWGEMKE